MDSVVVYAIAVVAGIVNVVVVMMDKCATVMGTRIGLVVMRSGSTTCDLV